VTYNHENYIRQALDALFGQIIDDTIEVVIADDASSDDTLAIIKTYAEKDPRFSFKYLDNVNNLGITKNYQRGFTACTGDYVAVLEGDDYWISPFKLQRQIEFLDRHWECNLCSVNYFVYEEHRAHFYPRTPIGPGHQLITARDLIADNLVGNFSTCMYRKSALTALPKQLFDICSYDWIVNICVARSGFIGFLEEPMSAYRLHDQGIWTQNPYMEKLKVQLELIPAYDALTAHIYHSEFELLSNRLQNMISTDNLIPIATTLADPTVCLLSLIVDCLPPVLLAATRALIPPKLKRFIISIFHRGVA
jgi:glycosyltransferase involved in cell wall biosynthesis